MSDLRSWLLRELAELPMLFLIIPLSTLQPTDWTLLLVGSGLAIALATAGGIVIRQLYRWGRDQGRR